MRLPTVQPLKSRNLRSNPGFGSGYYGVILARLLLAVAAQLDLLSPARPRRSCGACFLLPPFSSHPGQGSTLTPRPAAALQTAHLPSTRLPTFTCRTVHHLLSGPPPSAGCRYQCGTICAASPRHRPSLRSGFFIGHQNADHLARLAVLCPSLCPGRGCAQGGDSDRGNENRAVASNVYGNLREGSKRVVGSPFIFQVWTPVQAPAIRRCIAPPGDNERQAQGANLKVHSCAKPCLLVVDDDPDGVVQTSGFAALDYRFKRHPAADGWRSWT